MRINVMYFRPGLVRVNMFCVAVLLLLVFYVYKRGESPHAGAGFVCEAPQFSTIVKSNKTLMRNLTGESRNARNVCVCVIGLVTHTMVSFAPQG